MGHNRQAKLDQLIHAVSRGERELSSIRDLKLREAVRLALRLHRSAAEEPDAYTRIRMRARVMGSLAPRRRGTAWTALRDNAWTALELLGRPAPYIVRAVAVASVLAVFAMGAVVASADTLPDDLLYPVKISAEAVRLALSDSAEDHAVIELSIAEHRLREAERLAANGRTLDALVASAMYSQHVASAAADLAPAAPSDLARQLETRFDADRSRARSVAQSLGGSAKSAPAAHVLALLAEPAALPSGAGMERIASTAAGVVEQLVQVAEPGLNPPAPETSPASAPAAPARGNDRHAEVTPAPVVHVGSAGDHQKASEVLKTLRKAAEETKAAAVKAKASHR